MPRWASLNEILERAAQRFVEGRAGHGFSSSGCEAGSEGLTFSLAYRVLKPLVLAKSFGPGTQIMTWSSLGLWGLAA